MNPYQWVAWLHVLSAFVFIFVHGVTMSVAFGLPKEKNPERMKLLLELMGLTITPMTVGVLGLLVTSIYMGISAGWWTKGWWGLSFAIFFAMTFWMVYYSRAIYSPIRRELGMPYMTGFGTSNDPVPGKPDNMEEVQRLIARSSPRLLVWVGLLVVGALLWLMRFKPF